MSLPDFQTVKRHYEVEQTCPDAHKRDRVAILAAAATGSYATSPAGIAPRSVDTVAYIWLLKRFGYIV